MTPSRFQVPPRLSVPGASVKTGPPSTSIFLKKRSAKKPMCRPSGDQNGLCAPSVPASGCALDSESFRTQRRLGLSPFLAVKTIRSPSGEISTGPASIHVETNSESSGGRIEARRTLASGADRVKRRAARPIAAARRTAATIQPSRSRLRRTETTGKGTPAWEPPSRIQFNSLARSAAFCQRSSGSFARHFFTM